MSKPAIMAMKRRAAIAAVAEVEDGMILGLGSGSTAELALAALAARVSQGLRVEGIATSTRTASLARHLGLTLTSFVGHPRIDLAIDGADEVEHVSLSLIKGLGGALLREKIVAQAARRMLVVIDETKLVDRLGKATPVPVEILPFGIEPVVARLTGLGARPELRMAGSTPFETDQGNYIADCAFDGIEDAAGLERRIAGIAGVVESGLFVGLADQIIIGTPEGTRRIDR